MAKTKPNADDQLDLLFTVDTATDAFDDAKGVFDKFVNGLANKNLLIDVVLGTGKALEQIDALRKALEAQIQIAFNNSQEASGSIMRGMTGAQQVQMTEFLAKYPAAKLYGLTPDVFFGWMDAIGKRGVDVTKFGQMDDKFAIAYSHLGLNDMLEEHLKAGAPQYVIMMDLLKRVEAGMRKVSNDYANDPDMRAQKLSEYVNTASGFMPIQVLQLIEGLISNEYRRTGKVANFDENNTIAGKIFGVTPVISNASDDMLLDARDFDASAQAAAEAFAEMKAALQKLLPAQRAVYDAIMAGIFDASALISGDKAQKARLAANPLAGGADHWWEAAYQNERAKVNAEAVQITPGIRRDENGRFYLSREGDALKEDRVNTIAGLHINMQKAIEDNRIDKAWDYMLGYAFAQDIYTAQNGRGGVYADAVMTKLLGKTSAWNMERPKAKKLARITPYITPISPLYNEDVAQAYNEQGIDAAIEIMDLHKLNTNFNSKFNTSVTTTIEGMKKGRRTVDDIKNALASGFQWMAGEMAMPDNKVQELLQTTSEKIAKRLGDGKSNWEGEWNIKDIQAVEDQILQGMLLPLFAQLKPEQLMNTLLPLMDNPDTPEFDFDFGGALRTYATDYLGLQGEVVDEFVRQMAEKVEKAYQLYDFNKGLGGDFKVDASGTPIPPGKSLTMTIKVQGNQAVVTSETITEDTGSMLSQATNSVQAAIGMGTYNT